MELSTWFRDQLATSAAGLAWAIEQVPVERRLLAPPPHLEGWPAARHFFHLVHYEEQIALPSLRQWLGGPLITGSGGDEGAAWAERPEVADLQERLREVNASQRALLTQTTEAMWAERRHTLWGPLDLRWVVSKTYQHRAEHTSDLLQLALFWDL